VEENKRRSGVSTLQQYHPRLNREAVEVVSDFIGIITGDKSDHQEKSLIIKKVRASSPWTGPSR
jgi:hypothetical protein